MTGLHDRTYHQAAADAMTQPLMPEERLWLATLDRAVASDPPDAAPATRRIELREAADALVDEAAQTLAASRARMLGLSASHRVVLRERAVAPLRAHIRATHRVAWRRDGDRHRARFVPCDEPLGAGEEEAR